MSEMRQISLNHYQQLMLKISYLSPYNAVHSVLIKDLKVDISLINTSIMQALALLEFRAFKISILSLGRNKTKLYVNSSELYHFEQRCVSLEEHASAEMNYAFRTIEFPMRFFVINHQSQIYFSITYNHWIADAYSISRLIEVIFSYLQEKNPPMLTMNTPNMRDCFKHIYQNKHLYYRYLGVTKLFLQFSRAFRTEVRNIDCTESGCISHVFTQNMVTSLLRFCKYQGITLNDLFITILANVFGIITQEKRNNLQTKFLKPKRDRIVIAIISNIREQSRIPLSDIFGLFLGFFYVSFKSPETYSFDELSKLTHAKTCKQKNNYAAIKQYLLFKIQTKMLDKTKKLSSKHRLFNKNTPITVGISNLNLKSSDALLSAQINQYIRFSPTAIVCPIVFNITTFNGCMSLGINFRKACYTELEVNNIKELFVSNLLRLSD